MFDVLVRSKNSGVLVRSSINEHVRVGSMFETWCSSSFNVSWNGVWPITRILISVFNFTHQVGNPDFSDLRNFGIHSQKRPLSQFFLVESFNKKIPFKNWGKYKRTTMSTRGGEVLFLPTAPWRLSLEMREKSLWNHNLRGLPCKAF